MTKIKRIEIKNFRAFPNQIEPFAFVLNGRNLLLFGENGSGKSSLFFALKEFFNIGRRHHQLAMELSFQNIWGNGFFKSARGPLPFEKFVNVFTDDPQNPSGQIGLVLQDGRRLDWNRIDQAIRPHKLNGILPADSALIVDCSRRAGFLSYLTLLEMRMGKGTKAERLFELVVGSILETVTVPVAGTEKSIHEMWTDLQHQAILLSATPTAQEVNDLNRETVQFHSLLDTKIRSLKGLTNELMAHFNAHGMEVLFSMPPMNYVHHRNRASRQFTPAELHLTIKFRGQTVEPWEEFLNEARLSALAVSLFMAGVLERNPIPPAGFSPLKLLILDDVLFGLDMSNRIPVLNILKARFSDFQILLLTHDRVWFELARGHLTSVAGWDHQTLIVNDPGEYMIPTLKPAQDDLVIAEAHLRNGDLKAAAVYARSAFEWKLHKVAKDNGLMVKYAAIAKKISVDDLWNAVLLRQKEREKHRQANPNSPNFVEALLIADVETVKSNVLNELSHTGVTNLNMAEVQFAIETIRRVLAHTFPKKDDVII